MELRPLTDDVLLTRLEILVSQERENLGDIIAHLAEIDRREIVVDRGFATLFGYCLKKLRYAEAAAFLRIRAARAVRHFPRVIEDLKTGTLHLDAIARLYPYLTQENSDKLLDQAAGAGKRKILAMVAQLSGAGFSPKQDVIRHLPQIIPLPYRRSNRDQKSNVHPTLKPKKFSRRIPAAIKTEVWNRDGGRCSYIAQDGRRCESRDFLEYDHILPWSIGGRSDTIDSIRLLCRPHNQRLAVRRFGPRRRLT